MAADRRSNNNALVGMCLLHSGRNSKQTELFVYLVTVRMLDTEQAPCLCIGHKGISETLGI